MLCTHDYGYGCTAYKEIEELPENQAEFYQKIISLIITMHVQKYHESEGLQSATLLLQDLPEMFQSHLIDLSKVAFETSSLNHCLPGLGLLKSTQCLCRENMESSIFHIFLHISTYSRVFGSLLCFFFKDLESVQTS